MSQDAAEVAPRKRASLSDFCLNPPATPRPGENVTWYQSASPMSGTLEGHRWDGAPWIKNTFGSPSFPPSFDTIRLTERQVRAGPNWERLGPNAVMAFARESESARFHELLDQRTPPGPRYRELIDEIHARGYEVFVIGGTTRDVIAGVESYDVDLSTTMPLDRALPLVTSMYKYPPKLDDRARRNGHMRLGGGLGTSDPYIDLSVFKYGFVGTVNALFGDDFTADLGNRDFACNAVYYEPVADILIDPTGNGLLDAESQRLRLVCDGSHNTAYHRGKIAVRFFKFLSRGFESEDNTRVDILTDYIPSLAALTELQRVQYMRKQILEKVSPGTQREILDAVRAEFVAIGAERDWETLIAPLEEALLG